MEKIKRAIEESKRNRPENKQGPAGSKSAVIASGRLDNEGTQFVYTQTRVVPLDDDHLIKNRIVSFNKNDHLSLGFDILRTQVIKKMLKNGWRTLAVTSPIPGCGKTMVSINLAMSIAHHTDRTALLVDFDLRRPSVAEYLALPSGPSFNEVFEGEASVAEALVNPGLDRFVVLPTAKLMKNSSEVLSSSKVSSLVKELRERYADRIVIFDLPPVLSSDDAMIMLAQVDCVLVVVGNGMVSKTELKESMRHIESDKLLGAILNKVDSSQLQRTYYDY